MSDIAASDFYAGAGGTGQGLAAVPGVDLIFAANHWACARDTYQANHPGVDFYLGDLSSAKIRQLPYVELHADSPECTKWSKGRGKKNDFKQAEGLFGNQKPDKEVARSRALMEDVPRYLRAVRLHYGKPVLAGFAENVTDVRDWTEWQHWVAEFRTEGYHTKLVALNSAHARPRTMQWAPQSRDRLYFLYWHKSLGRHLDFDKWLRPRAFCDVCDVWVDAIQVFKKPGADMGSYGSQYLYRCPRVKCRNQVVHPEFQPAASIIDWSDLGRLVGDANLVPKTRARILAGVNKFNRAPFLYAHAGHTFERRPGVRTWATTRPMPTQTATATLSLATPPEFPALVMRNNTERSSPGHMSTSMWEPVRTLTTKGHQSLVTWDAEAARDLALLVPYYTTGRARPVQWPTGTLSAKDRYGLAVAPTGPGGEYTDEDLDKVWYRMLKVPEIAGAMGFWPGYQLVAPTHGDKVKLLGNAVTPTAAELLACALVEAIRGEPIERDLVAV